MWKLFGGIRLKIISMIVIIILATVMIINTIILSITEDSLKEQAFTMTQTLVNTVSNFSSTALYERSYATKVTLDELLKKIKASKSKGLLDISIFYTKKDNNQQSYYYYTGFGNYGQDEKLSIEKTEQLSNMLKNNQTYIKTAYFKKNIDSYLFIDHVKVQFDSKEIELGIAMLSYNPNVIDKVIDKVLLLSYIATAIILAISVFFANYISVLLSRPIIKISKAAKQISSGDLDIKLNIKSNDEIGELVYEFNSMVFGLKERVKMKKFVSTSTMDMISSKDVSNINLGGEYQRQTFLFSDIRNFTSMSESYTPKEVVSIINFYLNLQSQIILKHDGDIDKYIGDEIMASFNGPNATINALEASIEIQQSIKEENAFRVQNNLIPCEVGIGINEGEVIVGNIGSNLHMDFTSIGSVVNLASRLCSNAKVNEILISKQSCTFDIDKYKLLSTQDIKLKGFDKPIKIYSNLKNKNDK